MAALSTSDRRAVVEQLGREPQTRFEVIARCPGGHPLVIRNHPVDHAGEPFPTLYWLTCPVAVKAVSRIESAGRIKELDREASDDPELGAALERAHAEAAAERERLHPGAEVWGGVGGARRGIKCLHAHYANHVAGGDDPIGRRIAEQVEPIHAGAGERVAAIDLGTNSIRLLVVEGGGEAPVDVARDMVITRLGQGVDRTGRFDPAALARTLTALRRYARRARALGAERFHVGATSAARDAANRDELLEAIETETGSPAEILTGEREAGLSFAGATAELDAEPPFLVFDIGGGSTELAVGESQLDAAISVDVGSVRITERVRPQDPPTEEDLAQLRDEAARGLAAAEAVAAPGRARTIVGVSGTTTTVQALALGLDAYDPEAIHGTELALADAERVSADLARMTTAERAALPVMARGREDVIVAGATILVEILRRWGHPCVVSERDILDGLALEALTQGKQSR